MEQEIQTNPLVDILPQNTAPSALTNIADIKELMINNMDTQLKAKANSNHYTQNYQNYLADRSVANPLDAFKDDRIKLTDYSIDQREVYKPLNSGELIPLFENYIPGTDNQERLAQQQSTGDKWANGVGKFFTKTGTAVLGGTIGIIDGVYEAINQGSVNALYDNDFTKWLDDLDTKMDYKLPNYYTKQEQSEGFLGSLNNANFWASDVLGAVSFTVGAIVSEGLWAAATGGTSLVGAAARRGTQLANSTKWGKLFLKADEIGLGVSKYKSWTKDAIKNSYRAGTLNKTTAVNLAKGAEALNTGRFLLTSSGYEAGVEARHYKREAEENFYREFETLNGRQPNGQEIAEFTSKVENSANALFAGNMGILSVSNAVMFGSLFNIRTPFSSVTSGLNKSLFGIGVEKSVGKTGKTIFKALAPTKGQKIFSGVFATTKPLVTEGIWEEGGQGIMSKTAGHWIESSYNPKYNGNTIDVMDAMYTSTGEQFSTKEGWKEMGIGFLIGGGASVIQGKGKFKELKDIQDSRKYQEKTVAKGYNTFSEDVMARRVMMNAKIQNAVERESQSEAKGDFVKAELASSDKLIAEMEFRHSIGENITDLKDTYSIALDNVTVEEWQQSGIENVEDHKQAIKDAYGEIVDSYKQNIQYAQAVFGLGNLQGNLDAKSQYAQALAYTLTAGENSNKAMDSTLQEIEKIVGTENAKSITISTELERLENTTKQRIFNGNVRIESLQEQEETLTKQLLKLQNAPKETEPDVEKGTQLLRTQERLIEVQTERTQLELERDKLAQDISKEISLRKGTNQDFNINLNTEFISGQDLANIQGKLDQLDKSIESYEDKNPALYQKLTNLSKQYKSAEESFFNNNNISVALSSGRVKLGNKRMGGLLGKIFSPDKGTDNFTQDFLEDLDRVYEGRNLQEGIIIEKDNSKNEQELRANIIEKIRTNTPLVETEQEYYNNNKETIDSEVNTENATKGDNPLKTAPQPTQTVKTETEQLKEALENALKGNSIKKYVGEDLEEQLKNKPAPKDIERYRSLLNNTERTQEESDEYQGLKQKLGNWRLLGSIVIGDKSLADIIDLLDQMNVQAENTEVKNEITIEDTTDLMDESVKSGEAVVYELTQNTKGNATVKFLKDGNLKLSHIKIATLLERLGGTFEILNEKGNLIKNQTDVEKGTKYQYTFRITPNGSEGSIDIEIGSGGSLLIQESDFIPLQQSLNLYIVDTGNINWTYKDLYEFNGQQFVEKESDFLGENLNGDTYSLQAQEEVEFFYDAEDTWNVEQRKLYKKGKITKEQYTAGIKIYIHKNGKNFQTLKASRESDINESILTIRAKAFQQAQLGQSGVFGSTQISQVVLGSPKLNLTENGQFQDLEFTQRATEQVVATGYILDNEFVLSDKSLEDSTDQSFVGKMSSKNEGKKIPVVVFKKGAHTIAYAVSLKKTATPKTAQLESILQNGSKTDVQKVKDINSLLIANGISPGKFGLISLEEEKLQKIAEELNNFTTFVDVDSLASAEYTSEQLINDATIQIDLEDLNRSISSPKLRIDLDSYKIYEANAVKYESMTDIEDGLSDFAIQMSSFINSVGVYVDSKGDAYENDFTDVFADREVFKKPASQLEKISNINIMRDALKSIPKKAIEKFGQEKVEEIRSLFAKLDFQRKQVTPLKTSETFITEDELKCSKNDR